MLTDHFLLVSSHVSVFIEIPVKSEGNLFHTGGGSENIEVPRPD